MIVVKVGGSLFDHPQLGPGLRAYLASLAPEKLLLVPGGGDVVEAIRKLDAIHSLGEEVCHWLALQGMAVAGEFLKQLISLHCPEIATCGLDLEGLPHSWNVTSDSIAARIAVIHKAERLVLLKSVDVPAGTSWATAATNGWVDPHFPAVVEGSAFAIEVVNFRRLLDELIIRAGEQDTRQ
ncbi:MAG: hypothetical protein C0467_00215 [Planctomycetaceae bacterium]|nr:hypothetical protein [Planctomycetaceae bacterium]